MVSQGPDRLSVASSQHLPGEYPASEFPLSPNKSTQLTLAQAVHARRHDYTASKTIRIKVGTWNVAAFKGTEKDLGGWFIDGRGISQQLTEANGALKGSNRRREVEDPGHQEARTLKKASTLPENDTSLIPGGEDVGIYALGLQEVVDINSAVEALRPFSDVTASNKFKAAMEEALPPGYKLVAEQQLIGLLLLIYASAEVVPDIHSVSTTSVGTGLMGYMGNKGAVTARIVVGETMRLVFINSHLSAGATKADLDRRNWDAATIIARTRFEPIMDGLGIVQEQGERIGDEDIAFWTGDLNYRLEGVPGDDVRKLLMLHTRQEYDGGEKSERKISKELAESYSGASVHSNASTISKDSAVTPRLSDTGQGSSKPALKDKDDPASLQTTIDSLLPHDELRLMQKAGKAFHDGWKEGKITFLPTYKYDAGTIGVFDSGEKKRGPSWCDRVLFRSRTDRLRYENNVRLAEEAKRKDAEMQAQGIEAAAESENTMFEYDPEADGDEEYDELKDAPVAQVAEVAYKSGNDPLVLDYYVSHQRVLSADHKPLSALFRLTYDSTDRDKKARVRDEVARELDKAENEGRPVVTIVVDGAQHGDDQNVNGVSFDLVRYDDPKRRYLTLANTGHVTALVGFVNQPPRSDAAQSASPKWLSVNFDIPSDEVFDSKSKKETEAWDHEITKIFRLEPGDTANVELLAWVKDKDMVKVYNNGEVMEAILILRVKDGRDHFVPVRGIWHASVHGRTLDKLIRIPEGGVRALQGQKPSASRDHGNRSSQEVKWSAPRELFVLIEAIESLIERVSAESGMLGVVGGKAPWLLHAGWPFGEESWTLGADVRRALKVDVNESLDNGGLAIDPDLPPLHRLEVLADVLLDFLRNLDDGVITSDMWVEIESKIPTKNKNNRDEETKTAVMEILSESRCHSISFVLVTSMLARTIQEVILHYADPLPALNSPEMVHFDLPSSPRVKMRRKTLDSDPKVASKQLKQANIAAIFADVLIRIRDSTPTRWAATEARRRELVELFLDGSIG